MVTMSYEIDLARLASLEKQLTGRCEPVGSLGYKSLPFVFVHVALG